MGTLGVEWVKKYNGLAGDLTNTKAQAEGFYNTLSGVRSFNWGDDLAWDRDFEQLGRGTPSSGTDTTWADNVDAVFFSGHGSQGAFHFGRRIDDAVAKSTEVVLGDWNLEFAALDACLVLEVSDCRLPGRQVGLIDGPTGLLVAERVQQADALGDREDEVEASYRR